MRLQGIVRRAFSALGYSRHLFEVSCKSCLFIFNYHEISESPSRFARDCNLNVPPRLFRRQIKWIKKNFRIVSPDQLLYGQFDGPAAMITFDDGFASVFREGGPILKEEHLPAVCFMNMGPCSGEVFWSGLVMYLNNYRKDFVKYIQRKYIRAASNFVLFCREEDLQTSVKLLGCPQIYDEARLYYGSFANQEDLDLSGSLGLFLANHLYNHFNAVSIPPDVLKSEYLLNEKALLQYPNYLNFFSYPFGQAGSCYSRVTDNIILSLGASRIFTAVPLANRSPFGRRLHRLSMVAGIDTEEAFRYTCIISSLFNELFRKRRFSHV